MQMTKHSAAGRRRIRAFPGTSLPPGFDPRVDTGFPKGNATNVDARGLSGHGWRNSMVNLIGRRCRDGAGCAIAAMALAVTLAGCVTDRPVVADDYPTDIRQRHPIAIREGQQTLDLMIGVDRGGLLPAQRAEVIAFAAGWRREGTGGIVIGLPSGTPNERAAKDALREVRSILAAAGVPPRAVAVRPYRPADPVKLATLRLDYPRMIAEAGPCGLWPRDLGPSTDGDDARNRPYWNFGCANQRNLAAMVEDPADLAQPRAETPASAARRAVMLDKYRKGENPSTNYGNANQGKISDLGQ